METSTPHTHEELAIAREQGFLPKRETNKESYTRYEVRLIDLLDDIFRLNPSEDGFLDVVRETLTQYGYKENTTLHDIRQEILTLVTQRSSAALEALPEFEVFQKHMRDYQEAITLSLHDPEGSDSLIVMLQTFLLLDELGWHDEAQDQLGECFDLADQLRESYSHLFE